VTTPDKKGTFIEIACGENHTIFRLENSQLLGCGSNTYGQLGIESQDSNSATLLKVASDVQFDLVACGSEHSFAIASETGDLYSWGLNFKGQLGLGDFENRSEPTLVGSLYGINNANLLSSADSNSSYARSYLVQMLQKRSKSKEPEGS
jgi:alpha-tubulin suppressor-like RCC1 family protein